jgi:aminoglycoside 3-N-acetyltransferase I
MKKMSVSYRVLAPFDVSLLKDLLGVFGRAFGEPHTYQDAVPQDEYLATLLGKDHFIAIAAIEGNTVVGGLAAYVLEKFERERKEVYIYDLAVSEDYRRRGIATGLIDKLRVVSRDVGAYVIFVQADYVDTPAIRLYESLGSKEEVLHFDIEVAGISENPQEKE